MTQIKHTKWLVVTDLDGTLLNHHDYTVNHALPAIKKLQELNIPVIFNTSKTFSESISLQNQLGIKAPFVVENGSCIYFPKSLYPELVDNEKKRSRDQYWEIILGKSHSDISNILNNIDTPASSYQLLSTCSAKQASDLTGLNIAQAKQAISRDFSEPLLWQACEKDLVIFTKKLEEHNLNTLQGGRFLHVLGNCDKGIATNKLKEILLMQEIKPDTQIKTIVLGDSVNDAAMLQTGDISIIVNSPSNHPLLKIVTPYIHTDHEAPYGWANAIEAVLIKIKE